ncbi:MAG: diguanylate cyclase, partial [Lysobacteraceae bacterium]
MDDTAAVPRKLRVVVVEDRVTDAEIIARELRSAGFVFDWTRVETEAQYLAALETQPNLIIADFSLPHFDGLLAVDLLVKSGLEIPFILVSGTIGEDQAVVSIQRGADDYLLKDRLTRIGPAVHRALEIRQTRKERMLALEDLHRSERVYRQLVDTLPIAMYSTDPSGNITLFNQAAVELWGQPPDSENFFYNGALKLFDLDGKSIPATEWPVACVLREHSGIQGAEYLLERPDTTRRHVLSYPHPVFSDDGTLTGAVSLVLDITELKHAQQAQLASEVFAQTTIDSVTAHICVLDETGKIVAVNRAWREFCQQNHPQPEQTTDYLGSNYLGICEAAYGPDASDAAAMATGIRQVLDGTAAEFTLEYPCHSPTEQRWFQTRVTRFRDASRNIVIAHENITERKRALNELEASELAQRNLAQRLEVKRARLAAAQRVAKVGSWETDLETYVVSWSDETHRIHETDPAIFHPTHQGFLALVHPEDHEAVDAAFTQSFSQAFDQVHDHAIEHRLLLADGRIKYLEERWQILFNTDGKAVRAIGTCQDVTERKQAELRIQRQNRVYALLSQVNTLIVRVRDRDELFREACRIAVEEGGFRMAMLGIVNRATNKVVPVASAGKDEELLTAVSNLLSSNEKASTTMIAKVVRDKTAIVSNDSNNDPRNLLGEHLARMGVRSLAVLPLMVSGEAVGILALYAREKDFFHDEEMTLLTELADDVALAIDHIENQARLDYVASYDQLTGLANRRLFLERLAHCTCGAAEHGHRLVLFLIDLERFKNINDTLGQRVGDTLLQQVAEWLTQYLGDAYRVARVGADQFAVALSEAKHASDVTRHFESMIDAFLGHAFRLDDEMYRVAAKFGGAIFPDDGADADILFKNAEAALKKAKAGGHRHLFYTHKMTETVAQRLNLE